jgi:hypothetical protein
MSVPGSTLPRSRKGAYFRVTCRKHGIASPIVNFAYSREVLEPMLQELASDPDVGDVTVEASTDWVELIQWIDRRGFGADQFEPALSKAITALVGRGDASGLARTIDIAATRVPYQRLARFMEVQLTAYAVEQWAAGNREQIHQFYDEFETHANALAPDRRIPEPRTIVENEPLALPPFVRAHKETLLKRGTPPLRITLALNGHVYAKVDGKLIPGRKDEIHDYLLNGAATAGHQIRHIDTGRITYDHPEYQGLEYLPAADTVVAKLKRQAPDIVMIDCNHIPGPAGLTEERITAIRAGGETRIVGFIHDFHGDNGLAKCRYWAPQCDIILTVEPKTEIPAGLVGKVQLVFESVFWRRPRIPRRTGTVFFSGTPRLDRLAFLSALREIGATGDYSFMNRGTTRSFSMDDYRDRLAAHQFIVNSGQRTSLVFLPRHHINIVTGRAYEALFSGCCLFEKAGSGLSHFANPGQHYIEFNTVADLKEKFSTFNADPVLTLDMSARAQKLCSEYYSPAAFWNLVSHSVR